MDGSESYRLQEAGAQGGLGFSAPLQSNLRMGGKILKEVKEKKKKIRTIGKICSVSPAGTLPLLLQEIPVRVLQRKTTRRNT